MAGQRIVAIGARDVPRFHNGSRGRGEGNEIAQDGIRRCLRARFFGIYSTPGTISSSRMAQRTLLRDVVPSELGFCENLKSGRRGVSPEKFGPRRHVPS
jgi:hypothetical protein